MNRVPNKVAVEMKLTVLLFLTSLLVSVVLMTGCREAAPKYSLEKLQQEFERREVLALRSNDFSKFITTQRITILKELLEEDKTTFNQHFALLTGQVGSNGKQPPTGYDDLLAQAFVLSFLEKNDQSSLVRLLSKKCPERVDSRPLEFYLASRGEIEAPNTLIKAYRSAGTNDSAQTIINCLDNAFPTIRQSNQSSAEFVDACGRWWEMNRSKVELNNDYPGLPSRPVGDPKADRSKDTLFLPKK